MRPRNMRADLSKGKARAHVETPEEREEREKEEANSPEILPGLRLPGTGGVFLLDQIQRQARTGGNSAKWQRTESEGQQEERASRGHQSDWQFEALVRIERASTPEFSPT